jgi:hypothetical protein
MFVIYPLKRIGLSYAVPLRKLATVVNAGTRCLRGIFGYAGLDRVLHGVTIGISQA